MAALRGPFLLAAAKTNARDDMLSSFTEQSKKATAVAKPKLNEDVIERRRREDEATRLREVVPRLRALRLELSESRGEGQIESTHIKRIALDHAPSVFLIPCGEPRCKHGSFDLTSQILAGLQQGESRIEAYDTCRGDVGSAACDRVLRCVAVAEYSS